MFSSRHTQINQCFLPDANQSISISIFIFIFNTHPDRTSINQSFPFFIFMFNTHPDQTSTNQSIEKARAQNSTLPATLEKFVKHACWRARHKHCCQWPCQVAKGVDARITGGSGKGLAARRAESRHGSRQRDGRGVDPL